MLAIKTFRSRIFELHKFLMKQINKGMYKHQECQNHGWRAGTVIIITYFLLKRGIIKWTPTQGITTQILTVFFFPLNQYQKLYKLIFYYNVLVSVCIPLPFFFFRTQNNGKDCFGSAKGKWKICNSQVCSSFIETCVVLYIFTNT